MNCFYPCENFYLLEVGQASQAKWNQLSSSVSGAETQAYNETLSFLGTSKLGAISMADAFHVDSKNFTKLIGTLRHKFAQQKNLDGILMNFGNFPEESLPVCHIIR